MDKKQLRKQILSIRKEMTAKEVNDLSQIICEKLRNIPLWSECNNLCLYMPVHNEVDVTLLVNAARGQGKKVWLPKVTGEYMDFYLYDEKTELATGKYDIKEPVSSDMLTGDSNTLIVMPGAVFSKENDRIGYGGGYYDRYLDKYPECHTVAVCYDFQIVESIPAEAHDRRPEVVLSETMQTCIF